MDLAIEFVLHAAGVWQEVMALPSEHEQRQWARTWEDGCAKIVVSCKTEAVCHM